MVKTAICVLVLACAVFASADLVTFQWDPNNPGPQGYRMYSRLKYSGSYNYSTPVTIVPHPTTTTTINVNHDECFVVRAYDGTEDGIEESGDSNEVCWHKPPAGVTGLVRIQ